MCRLAAFPPGTTADQAHEIVLKFLGSNDDGVGECYVEKGEFKLNKYPYSYKEALSKKDKLFAHMPYPGWTLAHVRFATHGGNEYKNTHPIIKGNIAVVHNGIFSAAPLIKAAMADSVKWSGDTDTEVAAYMLNKLGAKEFWKAMPSGAGVYLALHRDGSLEAVKLGGDLELVRTEQDTFILASEFPWTQAYRGNRDAAPGVLQLDAEGHALNFDFKKESSEKKDWWGNRGYGTPTTSSGYTSSDIGYARGMPPTHDATETPQCQTGCNAGAKAVSTPAKPNVPLKKRLDLWSWPSDAELSNLEKENFE